MALFRRLGEPWKVFGGLGGLLGGSRPSGLAPVTFLFRDDFITPEAAPIASPRTPEPGPGTGTSIDTGADQSIAAGNLAVTNGGAGWGDPAYWTNLQTRASGLAYYSTRTAVHNNAQNILGWSDAQVGLNDVYTFYFVAGNIQVRSDTGISFPIETYAINTVYETFVILRDTGAFYIIGGGAFADWTLIYTSDGGVTAGLYGMINALTDGFLRQSQTMRVSQLPTPWNSDYGVATERLSGARGAGDTFTHEADCLIEFTATTVPAALQAELRFRIQDATNYCQVTINSAGDLELDEVVAGVPAQRGVSAGAVSNGERIMIIAVDETIRVYEDDTLRITYALAANFKTETSGLLQTEGTGGSISDIVSWPRVFSGAANRALNRVADA